MFILDGTNQIDEYVLTTGNDVTTAKYVDTFTFSNTTQPWAITFNNIGTNASSFSFLYFTCCNKCIDSYLKVYNKKFKYIKNRELTG